MRSETIVISDWLANCQVGQWTPFEAATALKAALAKEGYSVVRSDVQAVPVQLQARPADGGDWINIFPAQLQWMAKEGHDVRAVEYSSTGSEAVTPAKHRIDRLEEERNTLQNSYGNGQFADGLITRKIAEIDKELSSLTTGSAAVAPSRRVCVDCGSGAPCDAYCPNALLSRLRAMPSSLNDACRTMEEAAAVIEGAASIRRASDMGNLNVTDEDREFSAQILDDFGTFEEGIADQEKLAQWARNIRHAAERKAATALPYTGNGGEK